MAMATSAWQALVIMVIATAAMVSTVSGTALQYNFYSSSCPKAEEAIRNATQKIIDNNPTMGAAFVRLFFHDCFVTGCDASILLDQSNSNSQPEKFAIPLRGYAEVNTIKAAVEAVCPGVVSCADVLAYAARDSALLSGGFGFNIDQGGGGTVLNNNRVAADPNKLSNQYYTNLISRQVMFTSDQTLTSSNTTNKMVQDNAADLVGWMARFAGAMVKMGNIQVLTGSQGEIRRVCGATNSGN